ncbi:hypothetical protein Bca4012_064566 [Brassica carinata]
MEVSLQMSTALASKISIDPSCLLAKEAFGSHDLWKNHIKNETLNKVVHEESLATKLGGEDKWIEEDQRALEIIQGSLSISILEAYSHCETAKELWESLEAVYGNRSNLCRVFEVKRAINDLNQDGEDLCRHLGRFRCLWSDLKFLRPSTSTIRKHVINEDGFRS